MQCVSMVRTGDGSSIQLEEVLRCGSFAMMRQTMLVLMGFSSQAISDVVL